MAEHRSDKAGVERSIDLRGSNPRDSLGVLFFGFREGKAGDNSASGDGECSELEWDAFRRERRRGGNVSDGSDEHVIEQDFLFHRKNEGARLSQRRAMGHETLVVG